MDTVTVHTLRTQTSNGHVEVTFGRFRHDKVATIPCRHQDVISVNPLSVRIMIPPGARITDMRGYEGKEVILVLSASQPLPLDPGE